MKLNDYNKSLEIFNRVLTAYDLSYKEPNSKIALSLSHLGTAYLKKGDFKNCLLNYEKAYKMNQSLYQNLNGGNHIELASSLSKLGDYYFVTRNYNLGLDYYLRALNMNKQLYKGFYSEFEYTNLVVPKYYNIEVKNCYHPKISTLFNKIGLIYSEYADTEKALNNCQQAHSINKLLYQKYNKGNHPKLISSLNINGTVYLKSGDIKTGLDYFFEAYLMSKALYNNSANSQLIRCLNNIGSAYKRMRQPNKALEYFNSAFEMSKKLLNDFKTVISLNKIGLAHIQLGNFQLGLDNFQNTFKMNKILYESFDTNNIQIADSLSYMGQAKLREGDSKPTFDYLYQSIMMYQSIFRESDVSKDETTKQLKSRLVNVSDSEKIHSFTDHPNVADALLLMSKAYTRMGDGRKGVIFAEQALEMFQVLSKSLLYKNQSNMIKRDEIIDQIILDKKNKLLNLTENCNIAKALNEIGLGFIRFGDYLKGASFCLQAIEMYQNLLKSEKDELKITSLTPVDINSIPKYVYHTDIAQCLNNIGIAYVKHGDAKSGLIYCQQSLKIVHSLINTNHSSDIFPQIKFNNDVIIPANLKQISLAYKEYQDKSIECNKNSLDLFQADIAELLYNIGSALIFSNRLNEGLEYKEKSFVMRATLFNQEHSDISHSLNGIGMAYFRMNEYDKSFHFFNESYNMRTKIFGENHPDVVISLTNLGLVYYEKENFSKSLEYFNKSFNMMKKFYDEKHPDVANIMCRIGSVYDQIDKVEEAIEKKKKALDMRKSFYTENHYAIAESLNSIGISYNKVSIIIFINIIKGKLC